uniref:Noggin n=1 Tax=Otus sunia TaxID=257818 RepID=A0A8C8AW96_9STRI
PEERWQPPPPPSGTADPTAHVLHGRPSAPVQPYSLSLSPEDYCYSPKPWHLQPRWLHRLLGSGFDPFWMVTEEPQVRNGSVLEENLESLSWGLAEVPGATAASCGGRQRGWSCPTSCPLTWVWRRLVEQTACHLTWVDLGPIFWPSCSWPPGTACRPTQITQIKLLAWRCWAPQPPTLHLATDPLPCVAACKCSCH